MLDPLLVYVEPEYRSLYTFSKEKNKIYKEKDRHGKIVL